MNRPRPYEGDPIDANGVHANLVGGRWLPVDDAMEIENPSDLDAPIGHYAVASVRDVELAVEAARAAAKLWSRAVPRDRGRALEAVADELRGRADELGALLSSEEGKPLFEGVGEVRRAADLFDYYAGEAYRSSGELLAGLRAGIEVEVRRAPLGVVGIVTPWNFPIAIPAWKIAPALAYGNTVVFKPAELVPASAWALVEVLSRALPPGCVNLVMGPGDTVGDALVRAPGVDGVSFTGSVGVGRHVASVAASRMARVQLEMGGKNPLVVLADADVERAVESAVQGAYFSTGQRCTASSRLIVDRKVMKPFVAQLTERVRALRVGHALDAATDLGPVVDDRQLRKDVEAVARARSDGAEAAVLGEVVQRATRGHFLTPTLFIETPNDLALNRDEVFGPVAAVIPVDGYDEALAVANDTPFGLVAAIATTSLKHARHFREHAQAGMVMVNLPTAGQDFHAPFGGTKASSYGTREQGTYAREFYTTVRTSYTGD